MDAIKELTKLKETNRWLRNVQNFIRIYPNCRISISVHAPEHDVSDRADILGPYEVTKEFKDSLITTIMKCEQLSDELEYPINLPYVEWDASKVSEELFGNTPAQEEMDVEEQARKEFQLKQMEMERNSVFGTPYHYSGPQVTSSTGDDTPDDGTITGSDILPDDDDLPF